MLRRFPDGVAAGAARSKSLQPPASLPPDLHGALGMPGVFNGGVGFNVQIWRQLADCVDPSPRLPLIRQVNRMDQQCRGHAFEGAQGGDPARSGCGGLAHHGVTGRSAVRAPDRVLPGR